MSKLIEIWFDGDVGENEISATLLAGEEGKKPTCEITGKLPANTELLSDLQQHWEKYCLLGGTFRDRRKSIIDLACKSLSLLMEKYPREGFNFRRIKPKKINYGGSVNDRIQECHKSGKELQKKLNDWLKDEGFRAIADRLREELNPNEDIRILIRTEKDSKLQKLPWHLWDFVERYPKAEIALRRPNYRQLKESPNLIRKSQVRILAILGNSEGINVQEDRKILENLPNTKVVFLVEPKREKINDRLWDQPWDIIFFAGHSETEEQGFIHINQTDKLTIEDLWYGLRQAVERGLQLAIFNSCDGLGLARDLDDWQIPQMIVMREVVPDKVAQEFLKHFLTEFASGKPLYVAAREARERLQGLETKFPCASWLPVIWQNPAAIPPTWEELSGKPDSSPPFIKPKLPSPTKLNFQKVLLASLICTGIVMGVRYLGILEPLELPAYDRLMQLRPSETLDPKILIIENTQEDADKYNYPLQDATVVELVKELEQYKPMAIGLAMAWYQAQPPGREELIAQFRKNDNLYTVCAFRNKAGKIAGSPRGFSIKQSESQVGFSDLEFDKVLGDNTVRRQHLSYDLKLRHDAPHCITPYSFSLLLAYQFPDVMLRENEQSHELESDKAIFKKLSAHYGGYQKLDGKSNQILLNYRATRQPAQKLTLKEILEEPIIPSLIKDRVIIIGTTASIAGEDINTPYGKLPDVWIHAHMVSNIYNAATGARPLIWVLPQWGDLQWGDALFVWFWALAGGILSWYLRSRLHLLLLGAATILVLQQICLAVLIQGGWMPLVPSVISFLVTGTVLAIYSVNQTKKWR